MRLLLAYGLLFFAPHAVVHATTCQRGLVSQRLIVGQFPINENLSFDGAIFELLDQGSYILVDGQPNHNFTWDSPSDQIRFRILKYLQSYRARQMGRTIPVNVRGHFEIRAQKVDGADFTGPIFIIESFEPTGTIG